MGNSRSLQLVAAAAAFVALSASQRCISAEPTPSDAEQIMQKVAARSHAQDQKLRGYSCQRRYVLSNAHLHPDVRMTVRVTYCQGQGKKFTVLEKQGSTGIAQRVLLNLFEEEENASRQSESKHDLTSSNYRFALMGSEPVEGKRCYRIKITPLQKDKLLLDGFVWVDDKDFRVVHLEGRPARNLSFWVGRPFIKQDYCKMAEFYMPCSTESKAQVKLAGDTELHIQYSNYQFDWGN